MSHLHLLRSRLPLHPPSPQITLLLKLPLFSPSSHLQTPLSPPFPFPRLTSVSSFFQPGVTIPKILSKLRMIIRLFICRQRPCICMSLHMHMFMSMHTQTRPKLSFLSVKKSGVKLSISWNLKALASIFITDNLPVKLHICNGLNRIFLVPQLLSRQLTIGTNAK